MRKCQVCSNPSSTHMYTQNFIVPNAKAPLSYSIVCCTNCGFLYVKNHITENISEHYYSNVSRYTYDNGNIPLGLRQIHSDIFFSFDIYLKKEQRKIDQEFKILDIGCSTGHLLNIFKENGYLDVMGIDPSPNCNEIAKKLYNIKVIPTVVSKFKNDKPFNLIILSGVMEHIYHCRDFLLDTITLLKKNNGLLLVVVPDIQGFSKKPTEPFHEFSLEHVNFFSQCSLRNLLATAGLELVDYAEIDAKLYNSKALAAIFKNTSKHIPIVKDQFGQTILREYIQNSETKRKKLNQVLDSFIENSREAVVWGTGSYASRLIASSHLSHLPIVAFIDSNSNMQGGTFNNIKIKSPQWLKGKNYPVVIASQIYGDQIKKYLMQKLKYKGKILCC